MKSPTVMSAEDRRREIQAKAESLGIDEAYIALLVERFYERVREDSVLGPIFETAIKDNWGPHLARMKDFWAAVALNAGRYSGKPVPAHMNLVNRVNLTPGHFPIWLALFQRTLEETAPSPAATAYFMERAERIAQSLQFAIFGPPELAGAPLGRKPAAPF